MSPRHLARMSRASAVAVLALALFTPAAHAESSPPAPAPAAPAPAAPAPAAPAPAAPQSVATTAAPTVVGDLGGARTTAARPETAYAADFVARTLAAGGDHYVYPGGTYFDGGNTIDAILALDAARAGQDEAAAAMAYLEANLGSYIGTDFGDTYAGPAAKALLAAIAQGTDLHDVGGVDLLATVLDLVGADGRLTDKSAWGDYSNNIGQSLAVIALLRSGEQVPVSPVEFLLTQQCADGGFPTTIGADPCVSDPDATGFAAQALLAAATLNDPVATKAASAAKAALDRLESLQNASGGLASAEGIANANTTAVAAQAFLAGGRTTALSAAQEFLLSLQYDCTATTALRGGIAFSADSVSTTAIADSDLRATPQATTALAGQSLLTVSTSGAAADTVAQVCPVTATSTTPAPTTPTAKAPTAKAPVAETAAPAPKAPARTTAATSSPPAPVTAPSALAYTGTEVLPLALTGLGLLAAGSVLLLARRRGGHQ